MNYDKDSNQRPPLPGAGYAEDYTNAFLVSFGMLVFVLLFALVGLIGFAATVISSFLFDRIFLRRKP